MDQAEAIEAAPLTSADLSQVAHLPCSAVDDSRDKVGAPLFQRHAPPASLHVVLSRSAPLGLPDGFLIARCDHDVDLGLPALAALQLDFVGSFQRCSPVDVEA